MAETDQAQGLAVDGRDLPEQVASPPARCQLLIQRRQLSSAGEQQQRGVVRDIIVAEVRACHADAMLRRGVDVVVAVADCDDRSAARQRGQSLSTQPDADGQQSVGDCTSSLDLRL